MFFRCGRLASRRRRTLSLLVQEVVIRVAAPVTNPRWIVYTLYHYKPTIPAAHPVSRVLYLYKIFRSGANIYGPVKLLHKRKSILHIQSHYLCATHCLKHLHIICRCFNHFRRQMTAQTFNQYIEMLTIFKCNSQTCETIYP